MLKPLKNIFTIRTSPYNDNEKLEALLNEMANDGWEVYTIQETESEEEIFYNCIFVKEVENDDISASGDDDLFNFKSRIERMINPELDPYEQCLDIQKKIRETNEKIAKVKGLIDDTSEDSRAILNNELSKHIDELTNFKKQLVKVINPDIMEQKLGERKITLCVSEELLDILDNNNESNILSQIVCLRQNMTEKYGYILPKIKFMIDDSLEENAFVIKVRGIPAIKSKAFLSHTMYFENELKLDDLPKNTIKDVDAASGLSTLWIDDEYAKDYWLKGIDASDYICRLITSAVFTYIEEIFDYSDINRYIEVVGNQNLYLVENIIPDYMSVAELKYVLTNLVKEHVSIKDIIYIFEQINDCSDETDKDNLLMRLRLALSRQISDSIASDNEIRAVLLSEKSAQMFNDDENSEVIKIDGAKVKELKDAFEAIYNDPENKMNEPVIIAPLHLRHVVFLVLSKFVPEIRVIAKEEIANGYSLEVVGKV